MPEKSCQQDRGAAPLETATLLVLLLLPVTPILLVFEHIFDAIAAESIARHALRYSILQSGEKLKSTIASSVDLLAASWDRDATYALSCGSCAKGSLATFTVRVGDAVAVQVAGLEPK